MIKINDIRTTSYDVIAFYYYNSFGGNYDDTFGNTVTLETEINGGGGGGISDGVGVRVRVGRWKSCPKLINSGGAGMPNINNGGGCGE